MEIGDVPFKLKVKYKGRIKLNDKL